MKVLFLTYHYLDGFSGGCYASRAYINAFARLSEKLTVLVPVREGREAEGISPRARLIPVPDGRSRPLKAFDFYLRGRIHRYFGVFEACLAEDGYDTVVFDASCCSYKLIGIAHKYGKRVITIHHNYQYEYSRDNFTGPFKKLYLHWIRKIEREAVLESDLNLCLTPDDRDLLAGAYKHGDASGIRVLGAFEYESHEPLAVHGRNTSYNFLITGSLDSVQTNDSLLPWIEGYYPVLKKVCPGARLIIAGKGPGAGLRKACAQQGIELIASPPHMSEVLARGDFYLCPTSLGGGLKLRIMDGLRYGLPVVAHKLSARGYEPFLDQCLFAYDDVESFKYALRRAVDCDMTRDEVVMLYHSLFSFEAGVNWLKEVIEAV